MDGHMPLTEGTHHHCGHELRSFWRAVYLSEVGKCVESSAQCRVQLLVDGVQPTVLGVVGEAGPKDGDLTEGGSGENREWDTTNKCCHLTRGEGG